MRYAILFVLVAVLGLAAAFVQASYGPAAAPVSASCCDLPGCGGPGACDCGPGCCESGCCAPGAACCFPGSPCCGDKAKASCCDVPGCAGCDCPPSCCGTK